MSNDIVLFENSLKPLTSQLNDLLAGIMPADRLIQSAVMCVQKNPKLLLADRQSFLNTLRGSAILALEMDGTTGQSFPIPFAGMVQLVIGYKGYNTLGARAGITITGEVVRKGDPFDYDVGEGWVKHKPLGGEGDIIGAWAKAAANDRPSIVSWLPLSDILAIKKKSPGAKKSDSPWNDPIIGFPAMGSKSAKRRLTRSTPLTVQAPQMHYAARMEEAFEERGHLAYIAPTPAGIDVIEHVIDDGNKQPSVADITHKEPEKSDLLKLARAKAFEGAKVVAPWYEALSPMQRLEITPHLKELRALANTPEAFLQAEGLEAAEGGRAVLDGWWNGLPATWRENLDRYKSEKLDPIAAGVE